MYTPNAGASAEVILSAAVADSGTFDVAYPTGYTQSDFNAGLAGTGSYVILNDNDKWTAAAGDVSYSFGASNITVTNSSGVSWSAGSKVNLFFDIVDGNDIVTLSFPVILSKVSAADVVTDFRPGIDGTIEHWSFTVTDPVTTAAKLATLNMEIGTTDVTGGALALTSAAATPLGKVIAGAAITGANTLTKASKLSIEASSVTAFVEGQGVLHIRIRKAAA